MRRVRLRFVSDVEVEFVDRVRALGQVVEVAERGTRFPIVVYGPEGCGKTALLRQARLILEDHGYSVVYANPMAGREDEKLVYTPSIRDIVKEALKALPDPYSRIVDASITIASMALRRFRRPRVAVLMDDLFQAVGVDRAEAYTKTLLNLIEYPPGDYDRIVVLVASSEGVTRERVGRHDWATMMLLWNMPREGFRELYDRLPGEKPGFEDAWSLTGGNPRYLGGLYEAGWSPDPILDSMIRARRLKSFIKSLDGKEAEILREAINDPDAIFERLREPGARSLERKLVELNLIIEVWDRNEWSWVDEPPPEKNPELGIGRYYAWQTPLHREAVKRALGA